MDLDEVVQRLGEREAACRTEHDRLQGEADRIETLLGCCRTELERLVTARQVVDELAVSAAAAPVMAPVGGRSRAAADAELQVFGEQVLAVLSQLGRGVRCQEVVAALGEDASVARHVERVRHRLKKLRAAGRVAEISPGVFTLAGEAATTIR